MHRNERTIRGIRPAAAAPGRRLLGRGAAGLALFVIALGCGGAGEAAEAPHLPFFNANRDWVLRRFEAAARPPGGDVAPAQAWSFDPFADESALARLRAARAGLDSASTVAGLGDFRNLLDSLLTDAAAAGARLDSLDRCFARHLRTALEVTLAAKAPLDVERVEAWLDGVLVQQHTLSATERAAMAAGGVLEVLHRVVEPRAQTLEVRAWAPGATAPSRTALVVSPVADQLAVVSLDLQSAQEPARAERTSIGGGN